MESEKSDEKFDGIKKLNLLYSLKNVERANTISSKSRRHESSAEHTFSSLLAAKFFIGKIGISLDEFRVMKLLLYHDIIEIDSGDHFKLIEDEKYKRDKAHKEKQAFYSMTNKIPEELLDEFKEYYDEFEKQQTPESKFALAIDKFDPMVQELFIKEDWIENKFTEKALRRVKEKYFVDFPIIQEYFEEILAFASENGYFV